MNALRERLQSWDKLLLLFSWNMRGWTALRISVSLFILFVFFSHLVRSVKQFLRGRTQRGELLLMLKHAFMILFYLYPCGKIWKVFIWVWDWYWNDVVLWRLQIFNFKIVRRGILLFSLFLSWSLLNFLACLAPFIVQVLLLRRSFSLKSCLSLHLNYRTCLRKLGGSTLFDSKQKTLWRQSCQQFSFWFELDLQTVLSTRQSAWCTNWSDPKALSLHSLFSNLCCENCA